MTGTVGRKRKSGLAIGRYAEILSVLIGHGFGDLIGKLKLDRTIEAARKLLRVTKSPIHDHRTGWARVRMAMEELGPTFVKLGQFMSNRPDILPPALIAELEELQDSVKPFPAPLAMEILEKALGCPLTEVFEFFDETPLASASIAQVHAARLRSGERVAVKIRRPKIEHTVKTDLDILFHLVHLIDSRDERARTLRLTQLAEEFERVILRELDFSIEAVQMHRFGEQFKGDPHVRIPEVMHDFCRSNVLVAEYMDGVKVSNLEGLAELEVNPRDIAHRGADAVLRQVFDHGLFHADPHPGNILIMPDGSICFLDFGAVGVIPPSLRSHLSIILYGLVHKDPQRVVKTLNQLAKDRIESQERLEYDVTELINDYSLRSLAHFQLGDLLRRLMKLIVDHNLKIVPGFYVLLKALITIEGVGLKLDPEFNMVQHLEPHVRRLLTHTRDLRHLPYDAYFSLMDLVALLKDLPFELKDALRLVRSGDLRILFAHRGLEPMLDRHELLVNRLVFAIVLAALIVGSSLVVHADIPPKVYGIPVVGLVGFVCAALIGFGLLLSMIRHRRM